MQTLSQQFSSRGIKVMCCISVTWLTVGGAAGAETMFTDGFESGNLCAWGSDAGGPVPYAETFTGVDSAPWPAPWVALGSVALADLVGNQARFRSTPSGYSLSDIDGDSIHRHDPPAGISQFRTPSDRANGLAETPQGELLAAEHGTRRVSRTDGGGTVTTLVDTYQGMRFNSPNDLAVRSDGTLYFTDPDYGLLIPGDREIPFNGLFRRTPAGVLVAEWEGTQGANGPNGVGLSPGEDLLYATDTETGELLVWDVAADGSLAGQRALAFSLFIPDGLCVDLAGNVFVATWASTLEVFTADGTPWGSIAIPQQARNCAFGGADYKSLYVTAGTGLYRVPVALQGIP